MICKLCNNETILWEDKQFNHHYYYCENCELISQEETEYPNKEDTIKIYEHHNNTLENEGYVNMFKNFIDTAVMPYSSKGRKALDFGSGPTPVLAAVLNRDYGYEVDIYDLYYADNNDYMNNKYDLITSTEVIEHVGQPLEFLNHLVQHMHSDGIVALMTLFHKSDKDHFMDWFYRRDITHISFFTPKTFQYMAEKLDLEIAFVDNKRCISLKKVNHEK